MACSGTSCIVKACHCHASWSMTTSNWLLGISPGCFCPLQSNKPIRCLGNISNFPFISFYRVFNVHRLGIYLQSVDQEYNIVPFHTKCTFHWRVPETGILATKDSRFIFRSLWYSRGVFQQLFQQLVVRSYTTVENILARTICPPPLCIYVGKIFTDLWPNVVRTVSAGIGPNLWVSPGNGLYHERRLTKPARFLSP